MVLELQLVAHIRFCNSFLIIVARFFRKSRVFPFLVGNTNFPLYMEHLSFLVCFSSKQLFFSRLISSQNLLAIRLMELGYKRHAEFERDLQKRV